MTIPIICLTNGRRDCISQTIPSALVNLRGAGDVMIVDDSGRADYGRWLHEFFPRRFTIVRLGGPPGYGHAMRAVWELARGLDGPFFFLEDDFVFDAPVDLGDLAGVLDAHPHLVQIALLRQAWFGNEHEHGGLLEALEAQGQTFTEVTDGANRWIEHRACFTGNPSLIPRRTLDLDWPTGDWSESQFGRTVFADPDARGAYWGRRADPPRVTHIGYERVGSGY